MAKEKKNTVINVHDLSAIVNTSGYPGVCLFSFSVCFPFSIIKTEPKTHIALPQQELLLNIASI